MNGKGRGSEGREQRRSQGGQPSDGYTPQRQDYEGWLEVLGVSKLREPGISPSFTVPEPNCHFPPHSIHSQWAQESKDLGGQNESEMWG